VIDIVILSNVSTTLVKSLWQKDMMTCSNLTLLVIFLLYCHNNYTQTHTHTNKHLNKSKYYFCNPASHSQRACLCTEQLELHLCHTQGKNPRVLALAVMSFDITKTQPTTQ